MNRSKFAIPVVAAIASLYGAGCAEEARVTVKAPPPPEVVVTAAAPRVETVAVVAPPPPKVEVVAVAPVPPKVETVVVEEPAPAEIVVNTKPPVERVEVIPVAPSPQHVWIKGNWHWDGHAWIWHAGRYEVARVGLHWVPAHYIERGNAVVYVGGHWGR
jgi:hypothetical protein